MPSRAQQHHVVELVVREAHIALHHVVHDGLAGLRRLQPHDKGLAVLLAAGLAVAPAAVIAHRLAGRASAPRASASSSSAVA